jgi:SAM-dependent methyltransferase
MRFARYDRIVDHYPAMWPHIVPGYVPILQAMLDIVRVRPVPPRRILDLGCGPASATVAVAPACDPTARAVLVDGSPRMVEAARALLGGQVEDAVTGDFTEPEVAERLFGAGRFDLILCSYALHHLEDPEKRFVIDKAAESLVPGGLLLLGDEVANDRPAGWDLVERVRARIIHDRLESGAISPEFWNAETALPPADLLPFKPSRIDDLTSWMARDGLAVSCPVSIFGSALLVGLRPG